MPKTTPATTAFLPSGICLGTGMWAWKTDRAEAFRMLDRFYAAGLRGIDTAPNYPLNKNPADFRGAEKILAEWINTHGINDLDIIFKFGSLNNLFSPEHNLSESFTLMNAQHYRNFYGDNAATLMIHWDNRADETAIRNTYAGLQKARADGWQIGLSGIKYPAVHARINADYNFEFTIEVKHNPFVSDYERYAPLHGKNHRFLAYGTAGGGFKLDEIYATDSSLKLRGKKNAYDKASIEKVNALLLRVNADRSEPLQHFYQLGLQNAVQHPGIDGVILGVSNVMQLNNSLDFLGVNTAKTDVIRPPKKTPSAPATAHYDTVVIGGGLFGTYAALAAAERGRRVLLLEKENDLFRKASTVNQARLHGGYHYPRSVATARMSDENKARFTRDHRDFINFTFEKYYAVDKFGSLTDGRQFERFCAYLDLPCERIEEHELFNFRRLDSLYRTTEYTFDPYLLAAYYQKKLADKPLIEVQTAAKILRAGQADKNWHIELQSLENQKITNIIAPAVINAAYAGSNGINRLFGQPEIQLQHEIAEMAFITAPALRGVGLTVMDGQFGSVMPYGRSGLHSFSSVAYTHHRVSREAQPIFSCQQINRACRPDFVADCNVCPARPVSAFAKMSAQMRQYFNARVEWQYYFSKYTVKSKLRANHIDDGRPTEISQPAADPDFYCIFAGKINSIYEIEKYLTKK